MGFPVSSFIKLGIQDNGINIQHRDLVNPDLYHSPLTFNGQYFKDFGELAAFDFGNYGGIESDNAWPNFRDELLSQKAIKKLSESESKDPDRVYNSVKLITKTNDKGILKCRFILHSKLNAVCRPSSAKFTSIKSLLANFHRELHNPEDLCITDLKLGWTSLCLHFIS